jgi:hypothetical protein
MAAVMGVSRDQRRGRGHRAGIVGALAWIGGFIRGFHQAATATPEERRSAALARWTRRWKEALRGEFAGAGAGRREEEHAMGLLRQAVLGKPRSVVVEVLGVPRGTSEQDRGATAGGYWRARTWYYALSPRRRTAVAVNFAGDVVSGVEQLAGPHAS